MPRPTVSIITPTFNHEDFIEECIASVIAQEFTDWEQIVIDDGSTDATPDIVDAIQDERVRLIRQSNRGLFRLAETYNRALKEARGSLIAILEGDDFWPWNLLSDLTPSFDDPEVVLTYGRTQLCTPSGKLLDVQIPSASREALIGEAGLGNDPIGAAVERMCVPEILTFTFPCSTIIRKQTLDTVGGFQQVDGLPFTDFPTFFRLGFEGSFAYRSDVGGFWRQRLFSGTRVRDEVEVFEHLLRYVQTTIREHGPKVPFDLPSNEELQQRWQVRRGRVRFSVGRRMLVLGNWSDARSEFIAAMKAPRTPAKVRSAAAVGFLAGSVHLSLEPLVHRYLGPDHDMRRAFELR